MANKKIQIKNSAGDNLFPLTKKGLIDDFNHTHVFNGSAGTVSVTGTYSRTTGVTVGSIKPTGTVSITRSTATALSTTTISQITGVGSLPTRQAVSVVTGVDGGGGSQTLSYLHYTAPSVTKGNYTPAGSISITRSTNASVSVTNGTGLATVTVSGSILTFSSVNISASINQQPTYTGTFTGTTTNALVTGVAGGSLVSNTVSANGIQYVRSASFEDVTVSTSSIYQITGVGSLPTKGAVTVATGVSTQPNFTGTFTGDSITPTATITTSNTSISSTGTFTPTGAVGNVQ